MRLRVKNSDYSQTNALVLVAIANVIHLYLEHPLIWNKQNL